MAWKRGLGVARVFLLAATSAFAIVAGAQESAKSTRTPQDPRAGPADAAKPKKPAMRISVSVIFAGDPKFVDAAKSTCEDFHSDKLQDCFAREMKKANATPEAVEFSKQLGEPGFVRDFKVAGAIAIAYVFYPYRANENQSCLIVNGNPEIIDVDNHKLVGAGALKSNAAYLTMERTHKDVSLWPGDRYGTETPDVEMGLNAGAHIIVNYRLREQCHACAVLGHAWYSFDFDAKGNFAGTKLIGVSVTRDKAAVVRDSKKTVATAVGEEFTIALPMKGAAASEWMLAKGLDTGKVRLIEHSRVAPPSAKGEAGTEELWKFAAPGAGTTTIEFQNGADSGGAGAKAKSMVFRVIVRGRAAAVATEAKPGASRN